MSLRPQYRTPALLAALALLGWATGASAQPVNDACSAATNATPIPFSQVVDTTTATTAVDDPNQSCGSGATPKNSASVWYRFTAPSNGTVTANSNGSNYDTVISAFTGTCGVGLTEVACNDDLPPDPTSTVSFQVTGGTTYLFEVTRFGSGAGGMLHFALAFGAPPANDSCAMPAVIGVLPFTVADLNTIGATSAEDDPEQSCSLSNVVTNSASVWYQLTAQAAGTVSVDTFGSDYDTVLTANTGACGSLTEVACNDDANISTLQSKITFAVAASTTYLLEVTAFEAESVGGSLDLAVSFSPATPGTTPTSLTATPTRTRTPTPTRTPDRDRYAHADSDHDARIHGHPHANADRNGHADGDAHVDGDSDAHAHPDRDHHARAESGGGMSESDQESGREARVDQAEAARELPQGTLQVHPDRAGGDGARHLCRQGGGEVRSGAR